MNCSICKQHISKFSSLLVHCKIVNLLKPSSTYECTQNQFIQLFQNLNSIKKHTIKNQLYNLIQAILTMILILL